MNAGAFFTCVVLGTATGAALQELMEHRVTAGQTALDFLLCVVAAFIVALIAGDY